MSIQIDKRISDDITVRENHDLSGMVVRFKLKGKHYISTLITPSEANDLKAFCEEFLWRHELALSTKISKAMKSSE